MEKNNKYQPWVLTLISGFAVYIFDKLFGAIIPWNKVNSTPITEWLTIDIKLYQLLLFGIFFGILLLVSRKVLKNREQYYSKTQQKLREFDESVINGILWRWEVYFDMGRPFIANLTAYCPNHKPSPPLKMVIINNFQENITRCLDGGCKNNFPNNSYESIKTLIESHVEEEWRKLNKK